MLINIYPWKIWLSGVLRKESHHHSKSTLVWCLSEHFQKGSRVNTLGQCLSVTSYRYFPRYMTVSKKDIMDMIQKSRCDSRYAQLHNPKSVSERMWQGMRGGHLPQNRAHRFGPVPSGVFINIHINSLMNIQITLSWEKCLMWRLRKKPGKW